VSGGERDERLVRKRESERYEKGREKWNEIKWAVRERERERERENDAKKCTSTVMVMRRAVSETLSEMKRALKASIGRPLGVKIQISLLGRSILYSFADSLSEIR